MKRFLILAAVAALGLARPELYKEKEDFKYSRSSSDEGSKSGFYGAQRGNMGGNFERAHNMDSLAQNQMSGLVHQVDGELGDGVKTRTGSVYSAASSRGIYGSGHYDLSNLAGRNFQEGESHDDSLSSSLSSSAHDSAAYTNSRSHTSRYGGHHHAGHTSHSWQSGDFQAADTSEGSSLYDNLQTAVKSQSSDLSDYGQQASRNSGYRYYGARDANSYSGDHASDVNTRLVSAVPVRIIVRPGTRVAIPIGTQTYYSSQGSSADDANQRSSSYDTNYKSSNYDANQRSSTFDQSAVNSEVEALSDVNRHKLYIPKNDAKHYESSYSYRKQWEKHDTLPATVTLPTATDNYFPKNSELYEESQGRSSNHHNSDSQEVESSNAYSYNANVKSASSQSKYQSDLNSQRHRSSAASNLNAYTQAGYNVGSNADLNSEIEDINSKPKSYHSSYSYHKSWERQGDPYVIKPVSSGYNNDESSQRLSSGTKNAYGSGSHHQKYVDCNEACGLIRVARSYDAETYAGQEQLGQQAQNLEDFGQQSQNLEDFGQQSQNLEDFGQQSQNLEDFGQQSQNLENFGQQSQNIEDLSQQNQNLEAFAQESQNLEDFSQQNQNVGNIGQQSQNLENFNQQNQNLDNFGQQSQNLDTYSLQSQGELNNLAQNSQSIWEKYEDIGQQVQNKWYQNGAHQTEDLGQQTQHIPANNIQDIWNKLETGSQNVDQEMQNNGNSNKAKEGEDHHEQHQKQNIEDKYVPVYNQFQEQSVFTKPNIYSQTSQKENDDTHKRRVITIWDKLNEETLQNSNLNSQGQSSGSYFEETQKEIKQTNDSQSKLDTELQESHATQPGNREQAHIAHSNSEFSKFDFDLNSHHEHFYSNRGFMQESSYHQQLPVNDMGQGIQTDGNNWNVEPTSNTQSNWHKLAERNDSYSHNFHENTENKSPLFNLWNKFDNIEKQLKTSSNKSLDHKNHASHEYASSQNSSNSFSENLAQIQPVEQNDQIHSQDIGRGDIGPEVLSIPTNVDLKEKTSWLDSNNKLTVPIANSGVNNITKNNTLDQHKESSSSSQISSLPTFITSSKNLEKAPSEVSIQNNEQKFGILGIYSMDHKNIDSSVPETVASDSLFKEEKRFHEHDLDNVAQKNEHQNIHDVGYQHGNYQEPLSQENEYMEQKNIPNFMQDNKNIEQQSTQDFEQENVNLEQENVQDFGQQSMQDFGQQNIQDFGQQSMQDFGQQNIQDFGQQSMQDFGQQNIQDFGQQSIQDFGQQNIQDFGQQSIQNFEQQNAQDFGQQNIQDFGNQNENLEKQNVQDFEQQNVQDFGQQEHESFKKVKPLDNFGQEMQTNWKPHPEKIKEKLDTTQNNLQSTAPKSTEIEAPQDPVTEKPGFWKSLGGKFVNAKDKVYSWFQG